MLVTYLSLQTISRLAAGRRSRVPRLALTFGFRSPRHILLTLILLAATLGLTPRVGQAQITGLDFHGNVGDLISTIRFKFNNPHTTGLPIYGPGGAGATYIWRIYPRQQTGFYTTF